MKYYLIILLLLIFSSTKSQDLNDSIEILYNKTEYLEIIKLFDHQEQLNDISYYYIGYSYFMQSEYEKANEYYYKSLKINKDNPLVYYSMAISYHSLELKDSAIFCINNAIELDETVTDYLSYKGDLHYYYGEKDSAIYCLENVTKMRLASPKDWINLADVYADYNIWEKAEDTYKKALDLCADGSDDYFRCLYNMGLVFYNTGKFENARLSFSKIYERLPDNYNVVSKLIQCLYAEKNYKKADDLKKVLYTAREQKKLPSQLENMFCFDQFIWKDKKIMVFEKYDEPEAFLYYKHIFYVMNNEVAINDFDFTIQSEHSAALESVKKKYVMGMTKGNMHYTYWSFLFGEKFSYEKMKQAVIDILEEKVNPSSSSSVQ
ncbi:MAG: tetratricopeptide repeat protein [Bacteroidales bacterium]|nr:tetratricopeptide repeat protein [Bacteroidales bacterium]